MTNYADSSFKMDLKQYHVIGRALPTEKQPKPDIYRMKIFARDHVVAKSRFWYFMKKLNRIKKVDGEVLAVEQIIEENTDNIKNYGIWLRYDSRTHTHNMYKEYRDITPEGAVSQMYREMAGRHRAASCTIQIMNVKELEESEVKRNHILQAIDNDFKFPHIRRRPLCPKKFRRTFVAKRPSTFFN